MKGAEAAETVGDLASQQWGLVTTAQAAAHGVDLPSLRRLAMREVITRIRHGVYATTGTPLSAELEVKAHWLAVHPDLMAAERTSDPQLAVEAVVSHTTAAELWGVGDFWPDGVHFTTAVRRRSRQADVYFHRADLRDSDWVLHPTSGMPVTTVARTVADLADEGHEADHLLGLAADAARASLTMERDLVEALAGKEEVFGLTAGDRAGLARLVGEYFPTVELDPRIYEEIDKAMRPIREQIDTLKRSLSPQITMSENLERTVDGGSLVPDLFEDLRKKVMTGTDEKFLALPATAEIARLTEAAFGKMVVPEYPTLASLPLKRQNEESAGPNDQETPENHQDPRPDHRRVEKGSETPGKEPE
ncbi:type IV toxin-antitoxin system AbiEi family antitoxin domain-containing protein [Corynebacterium sanguinis]|uniref:type IV toxin-antitoxin system AbiEi family antitoxin domain-containing protein n=1 Tax=Corynebacterium sanguinis TaxID=2594913 RepID=UPI002656A28F|nr:type IV toxin-antitoxin system AbiEi family antitoxin domain-containing protein [Corynebacterium sanguinis]MDN8622817.1 type IV toxin-antitoxin system AbiEi family antitoxin domain-containing protein [Corynebacterium sanguinis]